ncbi:MAG TPA: glycosyltransferase, partial [Acidobacteriota bacterium]|nr:glycosyltransferase [Acidobacteriota bacterium]
MPLVSVIIAAHGLPDFLNEAVRSVGTQTFTDYEVIVVDDGSSEDVVARYRLPENARLIRHEKRVGAAA